MSLIPKYTGYFRSRRGVLWEVVLMVDHTLLGSSTATEELTFETDPLTIDWDPVAVEEPVQGSSATLRLESPGDRTYEHLYSIKPKMVRMDVYRGEGTARMLWWSGTLDPEFYSEPYERGSLYAVELTFSDFGVLDRIPFNFSGMQNLAGIIEEALQQTGIAGRSLATSSIATQLSGSRLNPEKLSVMSSNFYDEDGEAMTWREVLEGVLQPLGLRMKQRAGRIVLYDLEGARTLAPLSAVQWYGDSQDMEVDSVANNVTVTFSPYASDSVADCSLDDDEVLQDIPVSSSTLYGLDYTTDTEQWVDGFRFYKGADPGGLPVVVPAEGGAKLFRISSIYSGSDCAGIAWKVTATSRGTGGTDYELLNGTIRLFTPDDTAPSGVTLIASTEPVPFAPPSTATERARYRLKVSLDLLFDPRYNPFEEAARDNEEGDYGRFKENCRRVWIPVRLLLVDDGGNVLMHYTNSNVLASGGYRRDETEETDLVGNGVVPCGWRSGAGSWGDMWLMWYDTSDLTSTAINGWTTNRQTIGAFALEVPRLFSKRSDGEHIILPPKAGWLKLEIGAGVGLQAIRVSSGLYSVPVSLSAIRWLCYKDIKIGLTDSDGNNISLEDIEYSGIINPDAKDDIQLSTVCGTSESALPNSRGLYYLSASSAPLGAVALSRAGVTDRPEELLIGTLCSQYGERRLLLTGEALIPEEPLGAFSERSQPQERRFIIKGERMTPIQDTSELSLVEVRPEEYRKSE